VSKKWFGDNHPTLNHRLVTNCTLCYAYGLSSVCLPMSISVWSAIQATAGFLVVYFSAIAHLSNS